MAFIILRRSKNTRSYYLVESYRDDQGRARKRTLCYLGREQDCTDTLAKALAHWEKVREQTAHELGNVKGERRKVLRRRHDAVETRIALLRVHIERAAVIEAERKKQEQQAEEAKHWQSFDRLRRDPTEHNAREAKRAFLTLAMRHHPDQGGSHHAFLRVKDAYDHALAVHRNATVR
jgi:hypothetical protein